jgi:2-polyprenyl-3-methyl-5-hydroxy-6-metoxy-1,4-benzoquinol methylase
MGCNLCNANNSKLLFVVNGFYIVRCRKCGLLYVNPIPDESSLTKLYAEYRKVPDKMYQLYKAVGESVKERILRETHDIRITHFGKLLDIGCGLGYFLQAIRPFCKEVYGTEISHFQALFARDRLGINVLESPLTALKLHETFDTITMLDVIEHLPNPRRELQEIHRRMKKGGLIVIMTPNINSLTFKITRERYFPLYPPEHLFYFTPETLKKLLALTGFVVVKVVTKDIDLFNIWQKFTVRNTKRGWITGERDRFYRPYKHLKPLTCLKKVVDVVIGKLSLGDSLSVYAFKI